MWTSLLKNSNQLFVRWLNGYNSGRNILGAALPWLCLTTWLHSRAKEKVFDKVTPQCLFRKGKAEFGLGLYRAARETFQQALSSM